MYPEKDQKLRELQRNSTGMGYEAQLEIQHLCCLMILGVMPLCHVMPCYATLCRPILFGDDYDIS